MTALVITFGNGTRYSSNLKLEAIRFDGNSILGFRFPSSWPSGINVNFLEAEGDSGTYRPLCNINGVPFVITNPIATTDFVSGLTIKDVSFASIFYGVKNLMLFSSASVTGAQTIEVIVDKI